VTTPAKHSYGQILKSSALIGVSSIVDILLRVVRVKAMALWLGPTGIGLLGLYSSIVDVAQALAGLGLDSSGVRQIAFAVGSGEAERIGQTVYVLRRTYIVFGALGSCLLVVFSRQVSLLTFGSDDHSSLVALLSLAVFFRLVSAGQGALLRGMRRVRDLASMEIWGSAFATIISVPLIYFLRENGVVPFVVAVAAMTVATSWWYSRKVSIGSVSMTPSQMSQEVGALLKLGLAFMATGLLTMGVAYAVRVIVVRQLGVEAAGYYQSAWTIGGLYVGFILGAMGTDFYPRLTAVANANTECNRLVNEQAQVSLLLAGPGLLATLAFTPLVIALFYSHKFGAAVGALRWICLGMSLRVVTWPLGFILIAKGLRGLFVWIDLICAGVHLGLAWILVRWIGLDGAGMAFFGLYFFYGFLIYATTRMVSSFRWSSQNKRIGLFFLPLTGFAFGGFYVLPPSWATAVGAVSALASGAYSIRVLANLVSLERLPTALRQLLVWFRFVPKVG